MYVCMYVCMYGRMGDGDGDWSVVLWGRFLGSEEEIAGAAPNNCFEVLLVDVDS